MTAPDLQNIILLLAGFAGAIVNGAVGYGFSTIFTPVALLFVSNRVLNPALVLLEFAMNSYLLFHERRCLAVTWRRALPMIVGLLPGVVAGSVTLFLLLSITDVKLIFYALLLPLVTLQFLGIKRPIKSGAGTLVGGGVGFLYALTTISGPPLALYWRNQGLAKDEFRCSVSEVRLAEAGFTTGVYLLLGGFTPASIAFVPIPLLPILVGVPVGLFVLKGLSREFFGRVTMGVDISIVTFGLTTVLHQVGWISGEMAILILVLVILTVVATGARLLHDIPLTENLGVRHSDTHASEHRAGRHTP